MSLVPLAPFLDFGRNDKRGDDAYPLLRRRNQKRNKPTLNVAGTKARSLE